MSNSTPKLGKRHNLSGTGLPRKQRKIIRHQTSRTTRKVRSKRD